MLYAIMRSNGFDLTATADAIMDQDGSSPELIRGGDSLSPAPQRMDRDLGAKRPRTEEVPASQPLSSRPLAEPFVRAAAGSATSQMESEQFTGTIDPAVAALLVTMKALTEELQALKLSKLPDQVAAAAPAAVRAHDEAEAIRARQVAVETGLGGIAQEIRSAPNVVALGKIEGWRFNPHDGSLTCIVCEEYASLSAIRNASTSGQLEGPDFTRRAATADRKEGKQRRPLSVVKESMIVHVCGPVHSWCAVHAAQEQQQLQAEDNAAILCGRLVLQNLKEHDSDASYERRVAGARVSGAKVGSKNHSFHLVPKLRASMAKVLTGGFQKLLLAPDPATGRPPAFAVLADKATVQRKTGQMHGLVLMVQGVLIALFLSVAVAPDATGEGLAGLLVALLMEGVPLSLAIDHIRCSLTCGAFDGQYQGAHEGHAAGLDVLAKFCQRLKLNQKWLISRWDKAHCIELGMNEAREGAPWYAALAGQISESQQKYLYGKGYERVQKACSELKGYLKPAAIGVVCTTRFCHSERKVYKNFFRNLVTFITDKTQQVADKVSDHVEITKQLAIISSVTFVVHLAGLIDLLQLVKNISLVLQTVNQLPWELEEQIESTCALLITLAADLAKGDISRTLDPTEKSAGKRVSAFEFLSAHMSEIKQLKLSLHDPRGDGSSAPLQTAKLQLGSAGRASRTANPLGGWATLMGGSSSGGGGGEVDAEISKALLDLSKLAGAMAAILTQRLADPDPEARKIMYMARCLDLRKMAFDRSYGVPEAKPREPLRMLYAWLATRFVDEKGAPASVELNNMPPFDAVWQQWQRLRDRLFAAMDAVPFKTRWKGASGTVIMQDVFTNPRFYADCGDFLYLFQHCATKSLCEAVVEGMGGCWDRSSPANRHPSFESGVEEAVIAWSAPQPFHPEAKAFITKSLRGLYGEDYASHFHHSNQQVNRIRSWAGGAGKAVAKHMATKPRLPSAFYS